MDLNIKLEMFEGPLDLLLHLIDTSEVDVCDIPISRITDQYMEYVMAMQQFELEVASEFLVMAATLLSIKSRMLLPRAEPVDLTDVLEEEGVDPREELIQRLLEYKRYKRLSNVLREREEERSRVFTRMPADLSAYAPKENPLKGITPDDLLQLFADLITARVEEEEEEPLTRMTREEISVSDRMEEIDRMLERKEELRFSELFQGKRMTRERVVTTFLAILELLKLHRIQIRQNELFEEIQMRRVWPEEGGRSENPAMEARD